MQRLKLGIGKVDEMLEGGFPHPSVILISGPAGTGKTTLGLQFALEGAINGESSLYLSFEESIEGLKLQGELLHNGFSHLQNLKIARVWEPESFAESSFGLLGSRQKLTNGNKRETKFEKFLSSLERMKNLVEKFKPKRIVIDSWAFLSSAAQEEQEMLISFLEYMKKKQATVIILDQTEGESLRESFVDGIIKLTPITATKNGISQLEIKKMRWTTHGRERVEVVVGKGGIEIPGKVRVCELKT